MEIIDAQLHEPGPLGEWPADDVLRHNVQTEIALGWMDAVGTDIAILNPHDDAWGRAALAAHPERFRAVITIHDAQASDLEYRIGEIHDTPALLGARVVFGRLMNDPEGAIGLSRFHSGFFDRLFSECTRLKVPLFVFVSGILPVVRTIAESYPDLTLIVDHFGVTQPPMAPRMDPPWGSESDLLSLAKYPNVALKLCGAPVLSDAPYPYLDVWPHLRGLIDAFTAERIMWASDITRFTGRIGWANNFPAAHAAYPGKHTYAESLHMIRDAPQLTESEKALLLGGAARKVLNWV